MTVAKNIEISSSSSKSFDDAINKGIKKVCKTMKGVSGAWVKEQKVSVKDGSVTEYKVVMIVSFVIS